MWKIIAGLAQIVDGLIIICTFGVCCTDLAIAATLRIGAAREQLHREEAWDA
jgi:hypothetical protein